MHEKEDLDIHQLFLTLPVLWQAHSIRVARAAGYLYSTIVQDELYEEEQLFYTPREVEQAVLYHDIGFLTVFDTLSDDGIRGLQQRLDIQRRHTLYGAGIIEQYRMNHACSEQEASVWRLAAEVAIGHHECWNGGGYPHGELATAISLVSRITAVVNDFDRLLGEKDMVVREPQEALMKLLNAAGTRLDPRLVISFKEACETSQELLNCFYMQRLPMGAM